MEHPKLQWTALIHPISMGKSHVSMVTFQHACWMTEGQCLDSRNKRPLEITLFNMRSMAPALESFPARHVGMLEGRAKYGH
jgi:hypothetical protein